MTNRCLYEDCNRPTKKPTGMWCNTHSSPSRREFRYRKRRPIGAAAVRDKKGRKSCPRCDQWLPVEQFYRHVRTPDGLATICKHCTLLARHRLSLDEYKSKLAEQGGVCAICSTPPEPGQRLCTDHHHDSDRTRGLLCIRCNTGIGMFLEQPERLLAAVEYLARWSHLTANR